MIIKEVLIRKMSMTMKSPWYYKETVERYTVAQFHFKS
ncbi:hypothetical protein C7437_1011420 [Psychrobacillus insolitus]|uniref:Uncharacterized protein n=1 Tax=Psychrobacillus insolitus TaxID=1461 RepID=A0A2W7PIU5_9BACI|nr:hypothetical protein C7437_1011420 [Psychrobacillus insolitus]